jgi:uncharacterized protein involved in outer membrane biogenesis
MRRTLLIVAVTVLALLVAAGVLARRLLDPDTVRASLEQQASAVTGHPVTVAGIDWAVSMRPRLVLTGVQIGDPPAITVDSLELTTGLRALLSKRVSGASIVVTGSQIALPLPITLGPNPGTSSAASAEPARTAGSAFLVESIERIALENIELTAGGRRLRLDAESSLAGDHLTVSSLRLQSERTTVTGRGEITALADRRGTFSAVADPLDLDELLAIAGGVSGPRPARANDGRATRAAGPADAPLDIRVEIKAPRGQILGIEFAGLATTIALGRGGVTLDPFSVAVFDGTLGGRLHLDTTGDTPRATLSADVAGLDAARLVAVAGSPGVLTGRLGGQLALDSRGTTASSVFQSARGRASVAIADGTIPGLDLVGPAILAFGKPDPSKAVGRSRAFSRLGGTFTLADGMLQSSDLSMNSRDLDLAGRGSLRVDGAVADVRANLLLSEDLSAQAGRDLFRYAHEGSRIVLPATVTGPLEAPSVSIDLGAATGRALRNELEDQVRKAFGRLRKP